MSVSFVVASREFFARRACTPAPAEAGVHYRCKCGTGGDLLTGVEIAAVAKTAPSQRHIGGHPRLPFSNNHHGSGRGEANGIE